MDNLNESPLKRIPKDEYAKSLGITSESLRKMLNIEFYEKLKPMGYKKNQKYITVAQRGRLEQLAVNINLNEND